jgi:hypothetical protein
MCSTRLYFKSRKCSTRPHQWMLLLQVDAASLHSAAADGNKEEVARLLAGGAAVDATNEVRGLP